MDILAQPKIRRTVFFDSSPAIGAFQGDLDVDCGNWGSKRSVVVTLLGGGGRVNEM